MIQIELALEPLQQADRLSHAAVAAIAAAIQPGMDEAEALAGADHVLRELGAAELWHRTMIRFGANTLKTFREPSEPGIRLGQHDIFFVDIGPVWHGYEGDAAAAFTVGADPAMEACAEAARTLFDATCKHWREHESSGQELYGFADALAVQMGWQLNWNVGGHRIGPYPNDSRVDGPLAKWPACPAAGAWILEIHIRHPSRPFGAFFEGLLG